jgi:hypothetical protein
MVAPMRHDATRGLGLLDLVVVLGVLALLVYLVRLDWRPAGPGAAPPTTTLAPG